MLFVRVVGTVRQLSVRRAIVGFRSSIDRMGFRCVVFVVGGSSVGSAFDVFLLMVSVQLVAECNTHHEGRLWE